MAIELEDDEEDDEEEDEEDDDDDEDEEEKEEKAEPFSPGCRTSTKSSETETHDPAPHPERLSYLVKALTCSKKFSSSFFNFFKFFFSFLPLYPLTCDAMSNGKILDMYIL